MLNLLKHPIPHPAVDQGTLLALLLTVHGFHYTVVGHRIHMNGSKTSSEKLVIRKPEFSHPRPTDIENTNGFVKRGDKATAS
jgi:hypothetical protein